MMSKRRNIQKNWFTMLEVILIGTVFALLISGVILAINRTFIFLNNTRVQIRATNLTREGMEMMFNIRDTNRRKYSWEKDKYWLYIGSWDIGNINYFFTEWIYTIKEWKNGNWDKFVYAEKLNGTDMITFYEDLDSFFSETNSDYINSREKSKLIFIWTYNYWSWSAASGSMFTWNISDILWNGVEFYRVARVYGIYEKNSNDSNSPVNGISALQNSDPKEIRFCVKTFYKMGVWLHSTELCSIMTNFMG